MDSLDDENVVPVERRTPSPPPRPVEDLSMKNISLRFECPNNFEEVPRLVERSQLRLEDVAGKKELWLIRVPNNFDSSSMNGVELDLKRTSQFSCGRKKYQAVSKKLKKNQTKSSTEVLLPNEHGVLCSGPQFKGHVTVMEVPDVPSIKIPASPPSPKMELPSGMRQRYQPFGCDTSKKTKDREAETPKKTKDREAEDTDRSSSPSKKKKKKKKKKSHECLDTTEERISYKSEEDIDSSFTNLLHSTPTEEEEEDQSSAVKRKATEEVFDPAANVKKKKKKAKKEKR